MTWRERLEEAKERSNFYPHDKVDVKILKTSAIADRPEFKTHDLVYTELSDEAIDLNEKFAMCVGFSSIYQAQDFYEELMKLESVLK